MKRKLLIIILCIVTFWGIDAYGQVEKYQAAYMYNFFSFIEWSSEYRNGNFNIGVLGNNDAIILELQSVAKSKKVISQEIMVLPFNSVDDITKCHVLFVPTSQSAHIEQALGEIGSNSTLLITSSANGISKGAAINFIIKNGKLNFELKSSNATKQNVKISSNLNQLAFKVY